MFSFSLIPFHPGGAFNIIPIDEIDQVFLQASSNEGLKLLGTKQDWPSLLEDTEHKRSFFDSFPRKRGTLPFVRNELFKGKNIKAIMSTGIIQKYEILNI